MWSWNCFVPVTVHNMSDATANINITLPFVIIYNVSLMHVTELQASEWMTNTLTLFIQLYVTFNITKKNFHLTVTAILCLYQGNIKFSGGSLQGVYVFFYLSQNFTPNLHQTFSFHHLTLAFALTHFLQLLPSYFPLTPPCNLFQIIPSA